MPPPPEQRDGKGDLKNTQALTEHVGCSAGYIITERRDGKVTVYARGNHVSADPAGQPVEGLTSRYDSPRG